MQSRLRLFTLALALLVPLTGCSTPPRQPNQINVLVFTRTQGFRHDSIPAGVNAMRELCAEAGYVMQQSEDPAVFNDASLETIDVVTFLNTTGDILNDEQQRAFEAWFRKGGGFLGIHSAADTEYDWPFYTELIGAHFTGHPPVQQAVIMRERYNHPAVRFLPARWQRTDEWYNYNRLPHGRNTAVLLVLDTTSYRGSTMGGYHPIAWCKQLRKGRMFYTGGGHTIESFSEPLFRKHLGAALRWVAHDEND